MTAPTQSPLSDGIQRLLARAAKDQSFRTQFLEDPVAAAKAADANLSPTEEAVLKAVPKEQLTLMVEKAEKNPQVRPAFVALTAAAILAVGGTLHVSSLGIRPDRIPRHESAAPKEDEDKEKCDEDKTEEQELKTPDETESEK